MKNQQRVIVLSSDPALAQQYLAELSGNEPALAVIHTRDFKEVQTAVRDHEPAAILVDEWALTQGAALSGYPGSLRKAVLYLCRFAPVVVVASPERQSELADLIATGVADFVSRVGKFAPLAAALVERRLRISVQSPSEIEFPRNRDEEDFGEILRHEVNNPLTGILGNAELLLAELRRRKDNTVPQTALQRLQTIADLAVRLRETVRRLSDDLQNRDLHARML